MSDEEFCSPGSIFAAFLASFDWTSQFLVPATGFNDDIFPALIQDLLDIFGYIDHLACEDDFVVPMDVAIEELVVEKGVLHCSVIV